MALKFMADGPTLRIGEVRNAMMSVTGTVWLPDLELKMSVPVYVPRERPEMLAVTTG